MKKLGVNPNDRNVVKYAKKAVSKAKRKKENRKDIFCGAAIEFKNGKVVTGKNSSLMHAESSAVINSIKELAEIPDKIHLLSPATIKSIASLKKSIFSKENVSLDLEEALIALSISAANNPTAQLAMEKLKDLQGCEAHTTHIPTPGDEAGLRKLGINLTSDPNFSTKTLFVA